MSVILYYHDGFNAQHRVPLGTYAMTDAQALLNLALERKQTVTFQLGGHTHDLDTTTARRILLVEEAFATEVLDRIQLADDAEDDEGDEDDNDSGDYTDEDDTDFEC